MRPEVLADAARVLAIACLAGAGLDLVVSLFRRCDCQRQP